MGIGSPRLRRSTEACALLWRCAGTRVSRGRTRSVGVRSSALVCALALAFASASAAPAAPGTSTTPRTPAATLSQLEANVRLDINAFRARQGLGRLNLSPALTAAARAHSRQMAQDGYFAHASPDGSPFWNRLQGFYPSAAYRYWSVGENLLWVSQPLDGSGALRLWLESPEHRANLMNPSWRELGVSALRVAQAPGVYHGLDVTIVTTDFGVRR
jgi:uncharacterized protein YkwD